MLTTYTSIAVAIFISNIQCSFTHLWMLYTANENAAAIVYKHTDESIVWL